MQKYASLILCETAEELANSRDLSGTCLLIPNTHNEQLPCSKDVGECCKDVKRSIIFTIYKWNCLDCALNIYMSVFNMYHYFATWLFKQQCIFETYANIFGCILMLLLVYSILISYWMKLHKLFISLVINIHIISIVFLLKHSVQWTCLFTSSQAHVWEFL